MRFFLIISLLFVLVFGGSYWYTSSAHICPVPIKYKLGDIDPRFNFSAEQAKAVLLEAEDVWEAAGERELFVYDEDTTFTVNFIYDERQQLARTEEEWRQDLDQQERESQEVSDRVDQLRSEYKNLEADYLKQRDTYEDRLNKYNQQVERYNAEGGAPSEIFTELKKEQEYLSGLLKKLLEAEKDLNDTANRINALGEESSEIIERYNANVLRYNEIFGRSDTFTQGDFKRERINIYKFSNNEELKKVLAHEFGHALGINHVEGETSVMYYLTKEQSGLVVLTDEDKEALVETCGEGTEVSQRTRQMIRGLLAYF
ncbi:MAG: matrixin family metalloprotease [Candidatus Nomurabacteria bacterium]|nr:matrixin family metalloprotease [Candidatus Nomurabacteria bacterium]USN88226.1 MAG: matrixin family metalloprotease [Candidatus Nomurabacteria bacterium]